jgi:hypothetical protein
MSEERQRQRLGLKPGEDLVSNGLRHKDPEIRKMTQDYLRQLKEMVAPGKSRQAPTPHSRQTPIAA